MARFHFKNKTFSLKKINLLRSGRRVIQGLILVGCLGEVYGLEERYREKYKVSLCNSGRTLPAAEMIAEQAVLEGDKGVLKSTAYLDKLRAVGGMKGETAATQVYLALATQEGFERARRALGEGEEVVFDPVKAQQFAKKKLYTDDFREFLQVKAFMEAAGYGSDDPFKSISEGQYRLVSYIVSVFDQFKGIPQSILYRAFQHYTVCIKRLNPRRKDFKPQEVHHDVRQISRFLTAKMSSLTFLTSDFLKVFNRASQTTQTQMISLAASGLNPLTSVHFLNI